MKRLSSNISSCYILSSLGRGSTNILLSDSGIYADSTFSCQTHSKKQQQQQQQQQQQCELLLLCYQNCLRHPSCKLLYVKASWLIFHWWIHSLPGTCMQMQLLSFLDYNNNNNSNSNSNSNSNKSTTAGLEFTMHLLCITYMHGHVGGRFYFSLLTYTQYKSRNCVL